MYWSFSCFSRWCSAVGCLEVLVWIPESSCLIYCSPIELHISKSGVCCVLCFMVCPFDVSLSIFFNIFFPDFVTHALSIFLHLFPSHFSILQHIYLVVLCCVSEDKQVYYCMMNLTYKLIKWWDQLKEVMSITVFY